MSTKIKDLVTNELREMHKAGVREHSYDDVDDIIFERLHTKRTNELWNQIDKEFKKQTAEFDSSIVELRNSLIKLRDDTEVDRHYLAMMFGNIDVIEDSSSSYFMDIEVVEGMIKEVKEIIQ